MWFAVLLFWMAGETQPDSVRYQSAFDAGFARVFSAPDSADHFFRIADSVAAQAGNTVWMGKTANQRGRVQYVKGDFERALRFWNRADSLFLESGYAEGRKFSLSNIGLIHAAWQEHDLALQYYRKALPVARAFNDTLQTLNVLYNTAISFGSTGQRDSSEILLQEVLNTAGPRYRVQRIRALMMTGEARANRGAYREALEAVEAAEPMLTPSETWDRGFLLGVKARAYQGLGRAPEAIQAALEGVGIQQQLNARWELYRLYDILAKAWEQQGNTAEAFRYLKLHAAYSDSVFADREKQALFRNELTRRQRETQRLEFRNQQQAAELQRHRLVVGMLLVSAAAGLIILYLVSRNSRARAQLNAHLEKTNSELTRMVQFRSELMSIVGHDMLNMMTSLNGFSDLIVRNSLTPAELQQVIPLMHDNLMRIQLTFANLFRWAEGQSDGLQARAVRIAVRPALEEVRQLFEPAAGSRSIELLLDSAPDTVVEADPDHLLLVLRNLVHNALKFTPGGGRVTLYAEPAGPDGVRIGVRDTGAGIPPDVLDRLLHGQGRITSKGLRQEKGTGLGLPAARQVLVLNGSKLEGQSTAGTGTDFHFTLTAAGL